MVGRVRTRRRDAFGHGGLDRGLNDAAFLVAQQPALAGVGIQRGHADAG
jgi:hypothetical protein